MSRVFYLGFTKAGVPVGRASLEDYGYRFAAYAPNSGLPSFGKTYEGALTNFGRGRRVTPEIVEVKIVTGKEYRDAFKAARS